MVHKNELDQTNHRWRALHHNEKFLPIYPSESVVRWMMSSWEMADLSPSRLRIVDIGSGGGRHTKLFCDRGFEVYNIDRSIVGLKYSHETLQGNKISPTSICGAMTHLPFLDSVFDGALSYGVFYYSDSSGMVSSINELHRILRPSGSAFLNLRTTDDSRQNLGKLVEDSTYLITNNASNEEGMVMHFLAEEQIPIYFRKFSSVQWEKHEVTSNNRRFLNSDWLISVTK